MMLAGAGSARQRRLRRVRGGSCTYRRDRVGDPLDDRTDMGRDLSASGSVARLPTSGRRGAHPSTGREADRGALFRPRPDHVDNAMLAPGGDLGRWHDPALRRERSHPHATTAIRLVDRGDRIGHPRHLVSRASAGQLSSTQPSVRTRPVRATASGPAGSWLPSMDAYTPGKNVFFSSTTPPFHPDRGRPGGSSCEEQSHRSSSSTPYQPRRPDVMREEPAVLSCATVVAAPPPLVGRGSRPRWYPPRNAAYARCRRCPPPELRPPRGTGGEAPRWPPRPVARCPVAPAQQRGRRGVGPARGPAPSRVVRRV